jgi:hypothetical protein
VKLRKLLLACGASLAFAGVASAQSPAPPSIPPGYRALPPFRIAAIVRASGFDPLFRPMRQGDTYVLRALDRRDVEYRLVIDAYTGRTMSVHATGARGAPGYGPYGGPVYGRLFGPRDDRFDEGYRYGPPPHPLPPRVVTHVPASHPTTPAITPSSAQPGTATQSASASPAPGNATQTPLPRPRPYVMEATSSVPADSAKSAEPQKAPPPEPAPQNAVPENPAPSMPSVAPVAPAATPPNNGGASMPPVTPLD